VGHCLHIYIVNMPRISFAFNFFLHLLLICLCNVCSIDIIKSSLERLLREIIVVFDHTKHVNRLMTNVEIFNIKAGCVCVCVVNSVPYRGKQLPR